jgi:microcystin-dependent protein
MADAYVAEIRIFPFNFAPQGWALCNGQIIPISQNTALFSLIGTYYGGNGTSTFALPNLQGMVAISQGQGAGLSQYFIGETAGAPSVQLIQSQMAAHQHTLQAEDPAIQPADQSVPGPTFTLAQSGGGHAYVTTASQPAQMNASMLTPTGSGQAHNNIQPYLTLNFCIALQGYFPTRS